MLLKFSVGTVGPWAEILTQISRIRSEKDYHSISTFVCYDTDRQINCTRLTLYEIFHSGDF
jgi:hypothetical protein